MQANSGDPDWMAYSAASGLGLHCLPTSNKKDSSRIWVKVSLITNIIDPDLTAPLGAV